MKQLVIFLFLISFSNIFADDAANKKNNPIALIKTSKGDIYVELYSDGAPKTVENFLGLAEGKIEYKDVVSGEKKKGNYFDGLTFHRVIKGFMIQGGDPLGNGAGGPGYAIIDEINGYSFGLENEIVTLTDALKQQLATQKTYSDLKINSKEAYEKVGIEAITKKFGENVTLIKEKAANFNKLEQNLFMGYVYDKKLNTRKLVKGSIAMANAGPNTAGSQFFINVVDTPQLNGSYTNFGEVVKGIEVAVAISEVARGPNDKPKEDVKIISIRKLSDEEKAELLKSK